MRLGKTVKEKEMYFCAALEVRRAAADSLGPGRMRPQVGCG
jgi:hypothetical protein